MELKIILLDADREDLGRYAQICRAVCEKNRVQAQVAAFANGRRLLFEMGEPAFSDRVDILIIEPDGGCEEVAASVRRDGYDGIIIYVSHTTDTAVFYKAFDAKVRNVVKKGDWERFADVFADALVAAQARARQYIAVNSGGEYRKIDIRDVYYFESAQDHSVSVCYSGGMFTFRASLTELEERLQKLGFKRLHRCYLVSMDVIHKISYEKVILNNGQTLPVSRVHYGPLKEAMEKWKGLFCVDPAAWPVII